jgi:hypothetical protein
VVVVACTKRVKRVNGYFTNRRQLPPRYPGGSAKRRVTCLEDTKKGSNASGASSRSGADGGPTTQLAPCDLLVTTK